jgi:DNA-binding Xre family transcriptional regulator
MTDDIISAANPAAPLDLGPYRRVESPPIVDPKLRRALIGIGGRLSVMMELRDKMPEALAREVGLSLETIEQVRAGTEPDIGLRSLAAICSALGVPLQIGVSMPNQAGSGD